MNMTFWLSSHHIYNPYNLFPTEKNMEAISKGMMEKSGMEDHIWSEKGIYSSVCVKAQLTDRKHS